jgi:hypothetical protein
VTPTRTRTTKRTDFMARVLPSLRERAKHGYWRNGVRYDSAVFDERNGHWWVPVTKDGPLPMTGGVAVVDGQMIGWSM